MNKTTKENKEGMQINPYSRLVSLPVHSENVFHFPNGIPAFEEVKEFVFLFKPDATPFLFMHALGASNLTFVCVDPFIICPEYQPRISDADINFLHAKRPEDILLLTIVTVAHDMRQTTTNLQGPLAINMQACIGKQIICEGQHYPIRCKIWDALNKLATDKKNGKEEDKAQQLMAAS